MSQYAENDAPLTTTGHTWVKGRCVNCGVAVPRPWAETCRTPGTAAALSLALRQGAREHLGLAEGDYWPSEIAAAQATFLLDSGWHVIPPAEPCTDCASPAEVTDCRADTGDRCGPCHVARCAECQDALADQDAAEAANDGRWS